MEAAVDTTIGTPSRAAARATASSPSGCTIDRTPTGASITGDGIVVPSTVVSCERAAGMPRSIRGTSRQEPKAARLASAVSSAPAEPSTYPIASSVMTPYAASRISRQENGRVGFSPSRPLEVDLVLVLRESSHPPSTVTRLP